MAHVNKFGEKWFRFQSVPKKATKPEKKPRYNLSKPLKPEAE